MDVADPLRYALERGASDIHLSVGNVPFIRVDGELLPAAFPPTDDTDTEGRFRVNVLRQRGTVA